MGYWSTIRTVDDRRVIIHSPGRIPVALIGGLAAGLAAADFAVALGRSDMAVGFQILSAGMGLGGLFISVALLTRTEITPDGLRDRSILHPFWKEVSWADIESVAFRRWAGGWMPGFEVRLRGRTKPVVLNMPVSDKRAVARIMQVIDAYVEDVHAKPRPRILKP